MNRFGCIPGDRRRLDKPRLDNQMKLIRLEVKVEWVRVRIVPLLWARRLHLLVCAMLLQLVFPRVPPLSPNPLRYAQTLGHRSDPLGRLCFRLTHCARP